MKNYIFIVLSVLFLSSCIEKKPNFKKYVYHEKTGQYFTFLANKANWSYHIYMVPYKLEGYEVPATNYLKFVVEHFNLNMVYILAYLPDSTYQMNIYADLKINLLSDSKKFKVIPCGSLSDSREVEARNKFFDVESIADYIGSFFYNSNEFVLIWKEERPTYKEENGLLNLFQKVKGKPVRVAYRHLDTYKDISKYQIQDAVIDNNLPKIKEWNQRKTTNSTVIHKWDACPMEQKFARVKEDAIRGIDWSSNSGCEFCQEFAAELESPKNYYSFVRFDSLEQYLWLYCPEKNNLYYSRLNLTDWVKNKK